VGRTRSTVPSILLTWHIPETQTGSGVGGSQPYGPAWADRYNFALVQRSHIIGHELQPGGDAEIEGFHVPGAVFPAPPSRQISPDPDAKSRCPPAGSAATASRANRKSSAPTESIPTSTGEGLEPFGRLLRGSAGRVSASQAKRYHALPHPPSLHLSSSVRAPEG
jgi:hypothetical protein